MLLTLIRKSIFQRPLRYILTGLAILFGVAAVSAVFIFTDGLRATFDELASNIESGYDIAVQPTIEFGDNLLAPTIPVEIADVLASVPDVELVQPRSAAFGVVPVDAEGELTIAAGGPNLGIHWGADVPNVFLQDGRPPESPTEFAMDIDSFSEGLYALGDSYRIQLPAAADVTTEYTLVGTFTFGDPEENALVGARIVAFEQNASVDILNGGSGYNDFTLIIDDAAEVTAVIADIEATLDDDRLDVKTREELIEETQGDFGEILGIFRTVLLVFAVIILFVSAFLIYNVFSITLGQRIKELGLLRAVGAYGSQITRLMLGEALMLGVVATILGIPAGMVLAWLLRAALQALGFPDDTGLPLSGWTVLYAVLTGVLVTVLAAVWPSIQARRVSPMAAIRDGANLSEITGYRNPILGVVGLIAGLAVIGVTLLLDGWPAFIFLPLIGGLLCYLGVVVIDRGAARFVMFPIGIALFVIALLASFSAGETLSMLGAGAVLAILGLNSINPIFARPAAWVLGSTPAKIIVGLVGALVALGSLGALGFGLFVLVAGVPQGIQDSFAEAGSEATREAIGSPALFASVLLAPLAYGLLRTAWGARGLIGQLARNNASRNPQRTATTAAALMIGLTLVTTVTIIGDSIKSSVSDALDSSITADWLIRSPQSGPAAIPFSTEAAARIEALDEIESVVAFRVAFPTAWLTSEDGSLSAEDFQQFLPQILQLISDDADLDPQQILELRRQIGTDIELNDAAAVDFEDLNTHVDPGWIERDDSLVGPNAIYIVDDVAEDMGLGVGDTFSALFIDLQSEDLVVAGIYENGFVLGNRVMSIDMWNRHFPSDTDQFLTALTARGVSPDEARAAIESVTEEDFPILEVQDKEEFAEAQERQIDQTLATVNVLLGLSAFIAALGILVALALAVFERTREIGLFRAVGATRMQTRWMIRWEGVIVAAFGGLMGLILGIALGVLLNSQLPEILVTTTTVPWTTLFIYLVVAAVTGLAAAVFPAWMAGRMDVLESITHE